jgi:peptidoglycan/LPS O-acetylase OafA/YrhL
MKARVPALDLLRLVAVLGVVLFHYGFRGPTGLEQTYVALPELAAFARYGFLGVPVFFVISGFVIARRKAGPRPNLPSPGSSASIRPLCCA